MKPILLHTYKRGLSSVKELKDRLPIKYYTERRYKSGKYQIKVINWGSSKPVSENLFVSSINNSSCVERAANKGSCYNVLTNLQPPTVLTGVQGYPEYNQLNLPKDVPVIVRTKLTGKGGDGTHYFDSVEDIPEDIGVVKMVSRYIPKTAEYRVHVFNNNVIHIQQKKRREGDIPKGDESKIRSYDNGWVFCHKDIMPVPPSVQLRSVLAVKKLGLNFGAVDIIYNKFHGVYVTEVNTAPAIEGTTADKYAEAIQQYYESIE